MDADLTFRPLQRNDFGLLGAWLAEPLVHRWWYHDADPAALERDFGPAIDGADPTELFVAEIGHRPFGLIQCYRIDSYPEYVEELSPVCAIPTGALSIDYLIGESDLRGRGLGGRLIRRFLAQAWARHPGSRTVLVPVAAGNRASWRSLESAGFVRVATGPLPPDNPADPPDSVVYLFRADGDPDGNPDGD